MPIMNGYEACVRINDYFTIDRESRPFIYALTADSSPETFKLISEHPFDDHFCKLSVAVEVKLILDQIGKKKVVVNDSKFQLASIPESARSDSLCDD